MKHLFPATVLLCLLIGCSRSTPDPPGPSPGKLTSRPMNAAANEGQSRFSALSAEETGIDFVHQLDDELVDDKFMTAINTSVGAGICVADVDGDHQPDIFVCSKTGGGRLYKQTTPFQFQDVTDDAGVRGDPAEWSTGAGFADVDNDGHLDLYVCRHDAANLLYINDGKGRFVEQAKAFGLDYTGASVMAAFCDYDLDGDLDMYLLTNRRTPSATLQQQIDQDIQVIGSVRPEYSEFEDIYEYVDKHGKPQSAQIRAGQPDLLFRNDGSQFSNVAREAGIKGNELGHNALWFDYNNDLWPDIYVSNDYFGQDRLYRNLGGGRFADVTSEVLPHTPWFSMGSDSADINRDGRFDLFTTDMSATDHLKQKVTMGNMGSRTWFLSVAEPRQYMRNSLFLNTHSSRFMEIAYLAGVDSTDWTWTAKFGDLDNDGWSDLFITNGMFRNLMDGDLWARVEQAMKEGDAGAYRNMVMESPPLKERNLAFRNLDGMRFADTSSEWGLDHLGISYSAVLADIDRDGDLDIVTNDFEEPLGVYRNNTSDQNSVLVELVGTVSNRTGYGAVVKITAGQATQTKMLMQARGYMASDDPLLHFGLGDQSHIEALEVVWPSGQTQKFENLDAGLIYTIHEPSIAVEPHPIPGSEPDTLESQESSPLFSDQTEDTSLGWAHQEGRFDDYEVQPLLPYQLSRLGPGVAVADVNADGFDDFFAAGGNGQSGRLYLGRSGGRCIPRPGPWSDDVRCEDMAPLFFDADGDGDHDLYISTGGVECGADDPLMNDRLYLNQGNGKFKRATDGVLPEMPISSSCAVAADFDRDGDLDLFAGGRVQPGKYPHGARSRLLQNNDGKFSDITESHAAHLADIGLVTAAVWSDSDNDGWLDLLVATEWGPVHFFRNNEGTLTKVTAAAGLADTSGWFNSLVAGDFNADGRLDYVAGNAGLNSKYKASDEAPALVYSGEFGQDGKLFCVEAMHEHGHLYPVRGKSCSTNAMPHLADLFSTYREFGEADLINIYTEPRLEQAKRFAANELGHLLLINRGDGPADSGSVQFEVRRLPLLAQSAPVFGMAAEDFDGDGHLDLVLAQNFFALQPETGRMDGGIGLLLRGDGQGNLEPVDPVRSGIVLGGDSKGLAVCDHNRDGWPDLIVAQNSGPLRLLQHNGLDGTQPVVVNLVGDTANSDALGARVEYRADGVLLRSAEVYGGSGYLSQSSSSLFFVRHEGGSFKVRWPTGMTSEHGLDGGLVQELKHP